MYEKLSPNSNFWLKRLDTAGIEPIHKSLDRRESIIIDEPFPNILKVFLYSINRNRN